MPLPSVARLAFTVALAVITVPLAAADPSVRPFTNADDEQFWLENMVARHGYSDAEVAAATGLTEAEAAARRERSGLTRGEGPSRPADAPLLMLPYPGGRHPRIGFLDGAVRPLRESKVSVFAPWREGGYAVADVPEAIWSDRGLIWLAHEHVPTVWTKQGITLEPLEWTRNDDGSLEVERKLPDGVRFGTKVVPEWDAVRMEMWLVNGSDRPLSDLRVQNCVMLKGLAGFDGQTNDNKVFSGPYAAARNEAGDRWIISAWEPNHRAWGNPPCPCIHSDPKFPDCPPGQARWLVGRLSFYEGTDIGAELKRIDATGWRGAGAPAAPKGEGASPAR